MIVYFNKGIKNISDATIQRQIFAYIAYCSKKEYKILNQF